MAAFATHVEAVYFCSWLLPCVVCVYICVVQDLNLQPLLLEQLDASYDVVLCVNGIQYLTQPETVVTEVGGEGTGCLWCTIIWHMCLVFCNAG